MPYKASFLFSLISVSFSDDWTITSVLALLIFSHFWNKSLFSKIIVNRVVPLFESFKTRLQGLLHDYPSSWIPISIVVISSYNFHLVFDSSPFLIAVFILLWAMKFDLWQAETQQAFCRKYIISCVGGSQFGCSRILFACFWVGKGYGLWALQMSKMAILAMVPLIQGWEKVQPAHQCGNSWPMFYWDLGWEHCALGKDLLQGDGPIGLSGSLRYTGRGSQQPPSLRPVLTFWEQCYCLPGGYMGNQGIYPAVKRIFIEYLLCAWHHYRNMDSIANKTDKISAFIELAF